MPHPTPWQEYREQAEEILVGAQMSEKGVAVGNFWLWTYRGAPADINKETDKGEMCKRNQTW